MLKTKDEYRDRLYKMRPNIYIGGEKVGRDCTGSAENGQRPFFVRQSGFIN